MNKIVFGIFFSRSYWSVPFCAYLCCCLSVRLEYSLKMSFRSFRSFKKYLQFVVLLRVLSIVRIIAHAGHWKYLICLCLCCCLLILIRKAFPYLVNLNLTSSNPCTWRFKLRLSDQAESRYWSSSSCSSFCKGRE